MIRAIIFDCFGVLLTDSLSSIVAALREDDPQKADRIIGLVNAASKGSIDPMTSRTAVAAELGLSLDAYKAAVRDGEVRNEALLSYIKELRKTYRTALLSNVIAGGLEDRFPHDELAQYFDVTIASGDVGFAKPEPAIYEIVAERLGVRLDECVMIDDREDYCLGAISTGMQAIQYTSFVQMKTELRRLSVAI